MSTLVLVGYATRYGSTQEVAEAVAETLRACGLVVDIQPVREVRTLAGYSAVVLGAPLFMFRWHKDALSMLDTHVIEGDDVLTSHLPESTEHL